MSWSSKQKAIAARACKDAGIEDAHRELILRQLDGRAVVGGRATSTSPKLTQADFNQFMATVEGFSGGQVKIKDKAGEPVYGSEHWAKQAEGNTRRQLIHIAARIYGSLRLSDVPENLPGVIGKALGCKFTEHDDLEELSEVQARMVIHALRAVAARHNVILKQETIA